MKSLLCLAAMLFASQAYSANLNGFHDRFEFVRKDGKLTLVRDKSITGRFRIAPYLKFIKDSLLQEQALMKQKGNYDQDIMAMLQEGSEDKGADVEQARIVVDSLKELEKLDIEGIFSNPRFKQVMEKYENKLGDAIEMLDPTIMANVENPTFFYKKRVTYQVVSWALNFAKKKLATIPLLNTASYVLVKVEKLVRERRMYHQNMLLHYLENFSAEDLGLTHLEANHIFSSIYEARIDWFAFWESRAAQANWDQYGTGKFYARIRQANNGFRMVRKIYDQVGDRVNYAFQEVTYKGRDVIVNLYNNENLLAKRPAIAMDMDSPKLVARKRLVLQLAELGLSFVTLPNFIKNLAENYMKSFYQGQKLTEGALFAYFEATDQVEQLPILSLQYMNPFDVLR